MESHEGVSSYVAVGLSCSASAFARDVVGRLGPLRPARARPLLWVASRLAAWGETVGVDTSAAVLLRASVIERFVAVGMPHCSLSTRRTARANLRFIARRLGAAGSPEPPSLWRDRLPLPYSPAEVEAFFALADAQPTDGRRHRLVALLCLGAGAGLDGRDLRLVTGRHIERRAGGVVVVIEGERARVVPVLARYHAPLLAAAAFAGDGFVCGGRDAKRRNVVAPLLASIAGGADLPRLEMPRLRAMWLCEQLRRSRVPELLAAAGVGHSQRVLDLARTLPVGDEVVMVEVFG